MGARAVQGAVGVAEAGLLVAAGEEPVLAAEQLVGDEVEGDHLVELSLAQPCLEHVGHAGQA